MSDDIVMDSKDLIGRWRVTENGWSLAGSWIKIGSISSKEYS